MSQGTKGTADDQRLQDPDGDEPVALQGRGRQGSVPAGARRSLRRHPQQQAVQRSRVRREEHDDRDPRPHGHLLRQGTRVGRRARLEDRHSSRRTSPGTPTPVRSPARTACIRAPSPARRRSSRHDTASKSIHTPRGVCPASAGCLPWQDAPSTAPSGRYPLRKGHADRVLPCRGSSRTTSHARLILHLSHHSGCWCARPANRRAAVPTQGLLSGPGNEGERSACRGSHHRQRAQRCVGSRRSISVGQVAAPAAPRYRRRQRHHARCIVEKMQRPRSSRSSLTEAHWAWSPAVASEHLAATARFPFRRGADRSPPGNALLPGRTCERAGVSMHRLHRRTEVD